MSSVKEIQKFIDAVRKDIQKLDSEETKLEASLQKYRKQQKDYNQLVNLTEKGFGLIEDSVSKFESKLKELGLNPNSQPIIKGAEKEVRG
ncbi:hypothetical protein [Lysinibacillus pakistanensis]|uniref:Uncharacterized protein n=1 Tax=Lysinibacillus pakistanensis TaxID=759811 RepID=A0ABX6DH31_9BACI|nr:hypothetical protein GDS87_24425 [Lysinibacillus pakistanensis]QGG54123.1 hypothetical protein GDS87_24700 [Lysinibacillus pakistanensis]